ncbi:MAG: GNAT family N-acetyltransferase [Syntrophobacter sp.]
MKAFIREVQPSDITELVRMGLEFFEYPGFGSPLLEFDPESFITHMEWLRLNHCLLVAEKEPGHLVGSISGIFHGWFLNKKVKCVTENWWWIDKEARGTFLAFDLLTALESWAREKGASILLIASMNSNIREKFARVMSHKGFSEIEFHFLKEL